MISPLYVLVFLFSNHIKNGPPIMAVNNPMGNSSGAITILAATSVQTTRMPPNRALIGRTFLWRSEEHTSELQSRFDLVCRLLLEKKKNWKTPARCLDKPS